jgi:probable rRNA maturation factor
MDSGEPAEGSSEQRGASLEVHVIRRSGIDCPHSRWVRPFLRRVAAAAGSKADEVTIVLTGDEEIRELNQRYRGEDRPTDVLSFPGEPGPDQRWSQGDIVISVERARRQAGQRHHPLEAELRYLLIHGFLHLMGHDHESDSGEMEGEERRLRSLLITGTRRRARRTSRAGS